VSRPTPITLGAIVQISLNAVLTVLLAFGVVSLTADQTGALYGAANAIVAVIIAVRTRSIVLAPTEIVPPAPGSAQDISA
jgi:hypothetical protein